MSMSENWFYADQEGQVGPLTLRELKQSLATMSNAKEMLVWCDNFPDWKRVGDVPELSERTVVPPPLPIRRDGRRRHDMTDRENDSPVEIKGIAGWLVLPILGTLLSPVYTAYGILQIAPVLANASQMQNQSLNSFIAVELVFNIAMFVGWIVAIIFAFRHKRGYPKLFLCLSAITLFGACVDNYIAAAVFNIPFEPSDVKSIARPLLTLAVWGPYMYLSKRVRNTFIE